MKWSMQMDTIVVDSTISNKAAKRAEVKILGELVMTIDF